jgi:sulfatase modifying factor 1
MKAAFFFVVVYGILAVTGQLMAQVDIQYVTVSDPGNVDDDTGSGSVGYSYLIGRTEVTNGQYRAFLNAVAQADPNALYNPDMAGSYGGIVRTGTAGSYVYTERSPGWDDKPVNYVSFFDAVRFSNWLHNGQPVGLQNEATTENGAYDLSLGNNVVRQPDARVFLPSESEWYKAAYYQGGTSNSFWEYATQSNTAPDNNPPSQDSGNSANYMVDGNYAVPSPHLTDAGAYAQSVSNYGTLDQTGSMWEWNERYVSGGVRRGQAGGAWYSWGSDITASAVPTDSDPVNSQTWHLGFRVASMPERSGDVIPVANANFEAVIGIPDALPTFTDYWAGDPASVVSAENGITPHEGSGMLKFLPGSSDCDIWQLIDMSSHQSVIASGNAILSLSALFNRVGAGDPGFRVLITAYDGSPSDFPSDAGDYLAYSLTNVYTDVDLMSWEMGMAELQLPANTSYVGLKLKAEGGFQGHYADYVNVTLVPEPATMSLLALGGLALLRRRGSP